MENGIREILKANYPLLMDNITEPHILANCIKVFTPIDLERIKAEERERGNSIGVFELLNRLQKRGSKAFPQFIEALKNQYPELTDKLEREAVSKNLYFGSIIHESVDSPPDGDKRPIPRGSWAVPNERSHSSPVQQSSTNQIQPEEKMHSFRPGPGLVNLNIPAPADLQLHEEVNSKQPKTKGKDTLLKDISSNLKDRIVTMLNVSSALNNNWKGIAGEIKLTAEQQGEIGSLPSPMEELFKQMVYKQYCVNNLVDMLLKIERHDVVTEISDAGYYSQNQEESEALLIRTPSQVSEQGSFDDSQIIKCQDDMDSDETLPPSTKEFDSHESATNKLEEKEEDTKSSTVVGPSPTQISAFRSNDLSKKIDEKEKEAKGSTTGLPSPTKESQLNSKIPTTKMDKKNDDASSNAIFLPSKESQFNSKIPTTKMDKKNDDASSNAVNLLSPTQVSEMDQPTKTVDEKKEPHWSQEVEDGEDNDQELSEMTPIEEDVFLTDTLDGKAIFISCGKYRSMKKLNQLTQQVKQLSRALEDFSWDRPAWIIDYESMRMKNELNHKLHTLKKTDVFFVYLAGHIIQINGENYLLPIDIDLTLSTADIIDISLNINVLIKELSEKALMGMLIVDGGHFNEGQFESPIALTGLTAIIPPSNTVIAFPCQPGYVRPHEEMLLYIKALINVIKEEKELSPTTLFTKVKETLQNNNSPPVEFSLSRSLLPIYLNASGEDEEGITIQIPTEDTPRHAIVFCDQNFEVFKESVKTGTEHMEASLKQLGWKVEMYNNFETEQIKKRIRRSLSLLEQDKMNVFMLYFMGYVTKDKHSIGRESRSSNALAQPKISIQWLVNMMSQYVTGPKILIVDDPSLPVRHELSASSATPQEVLLCLPKINGGWREERNSFTLLLAQNLAASPQACLKYIIKTSATNWKYQYVDSNLFYA